MNNDKVSKTTLFGTFFHQSQNKIMFIKKGLFLSVFCIFIIAGCGTKITDTIGAYIKENCEPQITCQIEINKITPFSWDEFYFFDKAITDMEANKILNKDVFGFSSFSGTHKLAFFKKDSLIYSETQPTNIEMILDGQVYFQLNQVKKYERFPENAVFEIQKLNSSDGEHYLLNCINCN